MNKDQVKGVIKEATGKLQAKTGKIMGNHEQQAKGTVKEIEGQLQKRKGDVKEVVKDAIDKA